jgi:alpha,alpha-trehalase
MKRLLLTITIVFTGCLAFAQQLSPRQLYPGLFEAVQLSSVYPDNKTFVDAAPRQSPKVIMSYYRAQKNKPGFDLGKFVAAHFIEPQAPNSAFKSDVSAGVRKHIDTLWQVLSRQPDTAKGSSLLDLPHSYIVPGGRFREIYYWDSYFTMLGLQESHKTKMIENMVSNFAYLIDKYGFIPNGNRTYYLTRSQPPFFSMMVELLSHDDGAKTLIKYQPEMLKEYAYWMSGAAGLKKGNAGKHVVRLAAGELLNRYWDASDQPREESYKEDVLSAKQSKEPAAVFYRNIRAAAESGWDFSSRWFSDPAKLATIQTTDLIPVDLNCLMYHLEQTIAQSYKLKGDKRNYRLYQAKASARKVATLKYCWDNNRGWFVDYNWRKKQVSQVKTLAGVFPLEFHIADTIQAVSVAVHLQTEFLQSGGLVTTLNNNGQQWDSPNAWAPLQYMAIYGLINYHQSRLAKDIAMAWIKTNIHAFKKTGKLMEKYNVVDTHTKAGGGEYNLQDGFGWTNGVLLNLMDYYKVRD